MKVFALAAVSGLAALLALDGLWLTAMLRRFYEPRMGALLAESPNFAPAGVFYLLYAAGLAFLVVVPAVSGGESGWKTCLRGALFGLVCYGTYDLTNQATLKAWPLSLTVVDMSWGAALTGTACLASFWLTRRFA